VTILKNLSGLVVLAILIWALIRWPLPAIGVIAVMGVLAIMWVASSAAGDPDD
jgi:xanthosine utilization system XapX-like protein